MIYGWNHAKFFFCSGLFQYSILIIPWRKLSKMLPFYNENHINWCYKINQTILNIFSIKFMTNKRMWSHSTNLNLKPPFFTQTSNILDRSCLPIGLSTFTDNDDVKTSSAAQSPTLRIRSFFFDRFSSNRYLT